MNLNNAIIPGTQNVVNSTGTTGITIIELLAVGHECYSVESDSDLRSDVRTSVANQWINGSCFAAPTGVGQNGPTLTPGHLRTGFLQLRSGHFQEFPDHRDEEAAVPDSGEQLPEPSALVHVTGERSESDVHSVCQRNDHAKATRNSESAQYKTGQRIVELLVKFNF